MVLKESGQWLYNKYLSKASGILALLTKNVAYRIV